MGERWLYWSLHNNCVFKILLRHLNEWKFPISEMSKLFFQIEGEREVFDTKIISHTHFNQKKAQFL